MNKVNCNKIKILSLVLIISTLLLGCTNTSKKVEILRGRETKPDIKSNSINESSLSGNTEEFVMAVEDTRFKLTLKNVDVQIEESTNENLKTIVSSIILNNKTNDAVTIYLKYSWCDDVEKHEILANSAEPMKISTKVDKNFNLDDISLDITIKSKDDEVLLRHAFVLNSEINK